MAVPDSTRSALAPVSRFLRLVRPAVRRRPSVRIWDRIEAVLILVLSAAFFGSVPICFGLASSVFAADRAADSRAGVRYQVTAKVFPGPPAAQTAGSGGSLGTRRVRGTWTVYGVAVEFCLVVAVAFVYVTARWWLDHLRARGWDREWRRLTGVGTDA
ncbi:hypothetical protein AB0F91_42450 [Amycolatopsis sp. NPDC023774]|uniref:hypothetical protein n=1 Tax=Amycolatopsis sp. NPDC023774 TaxID=3155015 RepID=UPI0033C8B0FD